MSEERKLVSILFADIVGSTAHVREHDPEIVRAALTKAFGRFRSALESHGGTVEKFIGDGVMAVFGAPVAHEDDAYRAVRAAFMLRDDLQRFNESSAYPIAIRVGVDSGEVVAGTDDSDVLVTGEAVIAASRLQAAALPGEILVGRLARRLTEGVVSYGDTRLVDAKGIGSIEAAAAKSIAAHFPEPRRGVLGIEASLVGRDDEMRVLGDLLRRMTVERTPHLVTILGAPGVGKSRLAAEFCRSTFGARVLQGRSLSFGGGGLYAMQQILKADAEARADEPAETAFAKLRAASVAAFGRPSDEGEPVAQRLAVVAGLLPAEQALAGVPREEHAEELSWGVRRYFEQRALSTPLVLVFEDMHLADAAMLDLVENLARWARGPILLLCLARASLLEARPTWGGGIPNAMNISLDPLSAPETRALVRDLLRTDELPDVLDAELIQRSGGNPLHVEEFLRVLIESGHIQHRGDRWVALDSALPLNMPATLQALIAARLDALPVDLKRLLRSASVVGRAFSDAALASLLSEPGDLRDGLRECVRRDLVIDGDQRDAAGGRVYRFKHVLIRDVAYQSLPKRERVGLHRACAHWLESTRSQGRDEYLDLLAAYHLEQAFHLAHELHEDTASVLGRAAFDALHLLAQRALRRRMFREALELQERAAEVVPTIELTARERLESDGLGVVIRAASIQSVESVAALDDMIRQVRATGPSRLLAELLMTRAGFAIDESNEKAQELYAQTLSVAQSVGDSELIAEVMVAAAAVHRVVGHLAEQTRLGNQALDYARSVGASIVPQILGALSGNYSQTGEWTQAHALSAEAYRQAATTGSKRLLWRAAYGLSHAHRHTRGVASAIKYGEEALAIGRDLGDAAYLAQSCWALGLALTAAGEFERAKVVLVEGLAVLRPKTARIIESRLRSALGLVLTRLGDLREAKRTADLVATESSIGQSIRLALLAEIEAARGASDTADAYFRQSIETLQGSDWRRNLAEHRLAYGRFLVAQGRRTDARPVLQAALDFYSDPLAQSIRNEINSMLRAAPA